MPWPKSSQICMAHPGRITHNETFSAHPHVTPESGWIRCSPMPDHFFHVADVPSHLCPETAAADLLKLCFPLYIYIYEMSIGRTSVTALYMQCKGYICNTSWRTQLPEFCRQHHKSIPITLYTDLFMCKKPLSLMNRQYIVLCVCVKFSPDYFIGLSPRCWVLH